LSNLQILGRRKEKFPPQEDISFLLIYCDTRERLYFKLRQLFVLERTYYHLYASALSLHFSFSSNLTHHWGKGGWKRRKWNVGNIFWNVWKSLKLFMFFLQCGQGLEVWSAIIFLNKIFRVTDLQFKRRIYSSFLNWNFILNFSKFKNLTGKF
jgi:hypothetical protein